ncbi:hypothetical protein JW499_22080, partial [Amphritea sp. ZJ14W]|nr:hypothetical protein [Amphritea pacifica]
FSAVAATFLTEGDEIQSEKQFTDRLNRYRSEFCQQADILQQWQHHMTTAKYQTAGLIKSEKS